MRRIDDSQGLAHGGHPGPSARWYATVTRAGAGSGASRGRRAGLRASDRTGTTTPYALWPVASSRWLATLTTR